MKKLYVLILIPTIILTACDELVRTQGEALELKFKSNGADLPEPIELNANGTSIVTVTAHSNREMAPGQSITFSTTDGSLHLINDTAFSSENKTVTIAPLGKSASVLLRTSRMAKEEVFVGVTVNGFTNLVPVKFMTVCPEELLATVDQSIISIAEEDQGELLVELIRADGENSSDNVRLDLIVSDDDVVAISRTGFTQNGRFAFTFTPKGEGTVSISAKVNSLTCDLIESNTIELTVLP